MSPDLDPAARNAGPWRPESRALSMVRTPGWYRSLGWALLATVLMSPVGMLLVPWWQTVRGSGRVVAYAPLERQQLVEAPISGRVVSWFVQEGTEVFEGDTLLEIADIDPQRLQRLDQQLSALRIGLAALETQAEQYSLSIENIRAVGALTVLALQAKRDQAQDNVEAAKAALDGAQAELTAARLQAERKRRLIDSGAVSTRDLEVAEADFGVATSKVSESQSKLGAARDELLSRTSELERALSDAQAKVNSASAQQAESRSKVADSKQKIAELEGQISRQRSQLISAPRQGVVHRLSGGQGGEIVAAGDPLLVLVPQTQDRAVELWVDGNDAPLIALGSRVRLQFEGWPAVQFAGWPSVGIGTFGGTVQLIDPTDDGAGKFRVLIGPEAGEQWPTANYLRQGVRAKGWMLLDRVTVGWELWRHLNGFPPVIAQQEPTDVARKRIK
ncbi:MAG: secretion protein HlyD [Planctomyces sp.]|nr:secretion protein HlyD [Planctomyces sp.]